MDYKKYEYVELTRNGADIGREISNRHKILLKFLPEVLKIDFETTDQDACKMEHALGAETLDRLTDLDSPAAKNKRYPITSLNKYKKRISISSNIHFGKPCIMTKRQQPSGKR